MSDEALFREIDEDLQRDRWVALARRYGPAALGVALVVVVAVVGFVGLRQWREADQEAATARLTEAINAGQGRGGLQAADALMAFSDQSGLEISYLARLLASSLRVDADSALAAEGYRALADDPKTPAPYRSLAGLLLVYNEFARADAGALRDRLTPLAADDSPWRHSARELLALLAAKAGDRAGAAAALRSLAADQAAPPALKERAGELAEYYGKSGG